jgi:ABC-2 type transport system ATP-binding protein
VIEVADLRRRYRTRTALRRGSARDIEAVQGISVQVERGELFGLLGPHGAGKTTTVKILVTSLLPTGGTARVLGRGVVREPRWVRRGSVACSVATRVCTSGCPRLTTSSSSPSGPQCRLGSSARASALCSSWSLDRSPGRAGGGVLARDAARSAHRTRLAPRPEVLFLDVPNIGIDRVGARELHRSSGWAAWPWSSV